MLLVFNFTVAKIGNNMYNFQTFSQLFYLYHPYFCSNRVSLRTTTFARKAINFEHKRGKTGCEEVKNEGSNRKKEGRYDNEIRKAEERGSATY